MKVMKMNFRDYVECFNYKVNLLFWFKYVEFNKYGNYIFLYRRYFIDDFLENFFLFYFVKINVIVL